MSYLKLLSVEIPSNGLEVSVRILQNLVVKVIKNHQICVKCIKTFEELNKTELTFIFFVKVTVGILLYQ